MMEEDSSMLPTLAHLLEHLLDLEEKRREMRFSWRSSLVVNQPWMSYLKGQPTTNTDKWQLETDNLNLLIRDCKTAMLEFIPTYFQPIPVTAFGYLYFLSKGPKQANQEPFLIIRPQD